MASSAQEREVDQNYDFFQRNLSKFIDDHRGEFALLKSCEIIEFFATPGEAYRNAKAKFADGVFSIQEVTDEPIDLGFFSHA
ncbi:hypothetical protein [Parasphingopyxis sp.]|uniref:hypothetical protein n=1 Tax=Parasphingopyxis sp. TaxID=1920299 RepID=UPI002613FDA2|nr:hypothetical protein [Parasphingopyxis sp.]